ncbi:protein suppressor of npr1-1 [Pyrus ussuriensis x Pyrus communis]|uniref:Protein suppressor of npr1-1 n=1 Tax=Pyrus ussuriensis x Pyrus communis TaxID=2448454 RepID=A0A5N5F6F5_9ROSA|nr:protein suppressor of npr1-1 [Pyrus ussuriensis x Pyrus communis]
MQLAFYFIGRRGMLSLHQSATEAVETMILDSTILKEGCSNTEAFVSMTKLRLLMIRDDADTYTKHFDRYRLAVKDSFGHQTPSGSFIEHWIADLKFQSSQFRCLLWRYYPLKSWPSNFQFKNLVNLDMSYSCIEQLWKGAEPLEKLKFINLSHCQYLKKTPDFTRATSLEELSFAGCTRLCEVDPSISALKNLAILNLRWCNDLKILPSITGMKSLNLSGCSNFENLPSSIHMGSLQTLNLSGCSNLEKFPDISDVMEKLSELYLDGTAIKELPSSINKLTGLPVLDLRGCRELKSLPSSILMGSLQTLNLSGCSNFEKFPDISDVMERLSKLYLDGTAIKELPSSINKLTGLTVLNLRGCQELKSLPSSIHMGSLQTLNLSGCSNLEKFPDILDVMEKLSELDLSRTAIKELPSSINKLTGLTVLDLQGCRELKSLPSSIHMGSLQTLDLSGCSNLEKFPDILDVMEKLSELDLSRTAIKELPSSINKLTGLTVLDLPGCRELKSLPSSIHMGSLQTLDLSGCSNLEKFPDISDVMERLSELYLDGTAIKELPSSINKLTGLTVLDLRGCRQLKRLPSSIHMGSLQTLNLSGCSNLEKFPDISDVMEKLSELYLDGTAIKELPLSINKLTGLPVLDLRGCRELKSLPSSIHMGSLQTLDLSGCSNLEKFPDILDVMEKLSDLDLSRTAIKELPSSINKLTGLTVLDLRGCRELKSLPSSIHMGSLQTLDLFGCSNLKKFPDISDIMERLSELYLDETAIKELPSSINKLTGLTVMDLRGCRELKSLPSSIHMGSLETLNLCGCSNFEKFPDISDVMERLSELYLDGTAIKELPSSINKLTGLTVMDLPGCRELKSLPSSIHMGSLRTLNLSGCSNFEKFPDISDVMEKLSELYLDETAIKELPSSINKLTALTVLDLRGCRELKSLPSSILMGSLQTLNLSGCSNFEKFPDISDVMEKLSELYLDGTAIKELPSSINKLTGLTVLDLRGCQELKSLPSSIHMGSLQILNLSGCSNFEKFPDISDVMEKVSGLYLDGTAIKELPSSINKLTGLATLDLTGCRELKSLAVIWDLFKPLSFLVAQTLRSFEISDVMEKLSELYLDGTAIKELPWSIRNLPRLVTLNLRDCKELKSFPSSICDLKSLQYVSLSGCTKFEVFANIVEKMGLRELHLHGTSIKRIPPSIECLHGLVLLNLRNCKSLGSLPDDLCNLVSLTVLILSGCSKLQNLPEKLGNLESLWNLEVEGSGIKQLPLSLLRLNKLIRLSCHGCKEMTAPFSSWSTSMEDCSHRGLVHLDLSDCNLLELSGIAHLSSLKTLDLCRNNFESLPAEMNRLHRLTDLKLEGCKRLKSIPELSSIISFIDAHDCTALESVSRPKLLYRNLYFTFSNCFQLVQNLFEYIVEAHQVSLSLSPSLPPPHHPPPPPPACESTKHI